MERKSRYWSFLLYEDSIPKDWKEIITQWFLPVCVSPIHDKDIKEDGEKKKPHYHVLLCFGNTTTYKNALKYAEELGANIVKDISSPKGAYEYWTHKNNPEKAQYNEEDMLYFGGFTKERNIGRSNEEEEEMIQAIVDIINMKGFKELKEVYDYCNKMDLKDYRNLIQRKTLFIKEYVKSKRFMIDEIITPS